MDNIYVYLADFPRNINELVSPCADGYTVYINSSLSKDKQIASYYHALAHIVSGDFEKEADVQEIEYARHSFTNWGTI